MTPEQHIIEAASEVFLEKGYHGASIRDIAAKAGVNVSMINYYFRSKERLFDVVFDQTFGILFAEIGGILDSAVPFFDKVRKIVAQYIDTLTKQPRTPTFIFGELARNPQTILERVKSNPRFFETMASLERATQEELARGTIKPINPMELWINVISLSVFPFVARPMITTVGAIDDAVFDQWSETRKERVTQFIIDAIKL